MPKINGLTIDRSGAVPAIYIYDEIGPGWLGMIDAQSVVDALADLAGAAEIDVRINSPGGDVFEAAAIYNALSRFPGNVTVDIDGLAASAASVIAMAGKKIRIAGNALVMIHNAWTIVAGNADELRRVIGTLEKVDETIVATYDSRTGAKATREQIVAWMAAETWMSATEAVERGFADEAGELIQGVEAVVPAGRYRNVPRTVRQCSSPRRHGDTERRQATAAAIAARIRAARRHAA